MEPQLFQTAVENQLDDLQQEQDEQIKRLQAEGQGESEIQRSKSDLVLKRRMEEVRQNEKRARLEDLLYVSVLEKFVVLGVDMLPRLDGHVDVTELDVASLTDKVYSKEALHWVREHLRSVMGPATMAPSHTRMRISKLQMAQMYAASVLFGYFLSRVDRRFQLDASMGFVNEEEDPVQKLEELFRKAQDYDDSEDPDTVTIDSTSRTTSGAASDVGSSSSAGGKHNVLREYVERWDEATVAEMSRVLSVEAAEVVQRQTTAVCGDVKELMNEMKAVIGEDAISLEEVLQRVETAVSEEKVKCLTMTISTQRRGVLEAVAFGCFLRDVETWVEREYDLLTPLPPSDGP